MVAGGVQLRGKAHGADALQERRQISVQAGLAAGDGHAVQQSVPLAQEGEELLRVDHRLGIGAEHQGGVVAEGAAPVAAGREHRAGRVARIIQQSQLLNQI